MPCGTKKKKNAKLYEITYKLRNGKKKHTKYEWATKAEVAGRKHKHKFGKSHVILKVRLS